MIEEVKVWLVEGVKYNWTMLKVITDTGHTGVGEATNWPGSPIIEAAARHAGERIIGLDPMRTDFIWTKLYRDLNWIGPYGASLCAISGLDMALLDLKAKVLGVPMLRAAGRRVPHESSSTPTTGSSAPRTSRATTRGRRRVVEAGGSPG
jgi:galactonate dehydratase